VEVVLIALFEAASHGTGQSFRNYGRINSMRPAPFVFSLFLFSTSIALAGYQDCKVVPTYYNAAEEQFLIFSFCDESFQETLTLPEGLPSSVEVLSFDKANPGRKNVKSFLSLQIDGNEYDLRTEGVDKSKFDKEYISKAEKDLKEYLSFWTKRGFEKIDFISLKRNPQLSKSSEAKAYKYFEVYDWPNSDNKIAWKMKIEKGKIQEPFSFVSLSNSKETNLLVRPRSPSWTFTGSREVSIYTDSQKRFLLLTFSGSWEGMYFVSAKDLPAALR